MLKRLRNLLKLDSKTRRKAADGDPGRGAAVGEPADAERRPAAPREAPAPIHHGPRVVHHPIPSSDLDPDAVRILGRLTRFDHAAYLVGGCVRDLLLGRKPKDFDIGTSATPRQIKRLFSNSRIIGRRFRLAHVYFQSGKIIEVATFRAYDVEDNADAPAAGGDILIREDNVFGSPEEDALRRDFTINALFYDAAQGNVIDHADGLGDLRRRLVRTIGDPDIRFREDPIRILRAIKFAARLDFEIETATRAALERHRDEIPRAATPRVLEEINRFCRGGAARRSFELCRETGVFGVILPEIADAYSRDASAWSLLVTLLGTIDERLRRGVETSTGEIFAALILPLIAAKLGWSEDGKASPPKGLPIREVVDEALGPVARRLRVSRRDQERCRLLAQTLVRMVPKQMVRRAFRQSIVHRPSFTDALWFLDAIAGARGGDFAEAADFWRSGGEAPARRAPEPGEAQAATEESPGERRRRRRRRPRRRSGGAPAGAAEGESRPPRPPAEPRPKPERRETRDRRGGERPPVAPKLPAPWDDDYFFAALPSAPSLEAEEHDSDRYGASEVAAAIPRRDAEPASPKGAGEAGEAPRRRRRRSRRRRPKGGSTPPVAPAG